MLVIKCTWIRLEKRKKRKTFDIKKVKSQVNFLTVVLQIFFCSWLILRWGRRKLFSHLILFSTIFRTINYMTISIITILLFHFFLDKNPSSVFHDFSKKTLIWRNFVVKILSSNYDFGLKHYKKFVHIRCYINCNERDFLTSQRPTKIKSNSKLLCFRLKKLNCFDFKN